jgi:hypothetical protein
LPCAKNFPDRASSACQWEVLIYASMSSPLSRLAILAVAVLVVATATTASARPKKQSAQPQSTSATTCDGTPIIMQGMECSRRPVRAEAQQEPAAERPERSRLTARGSSGRYIAPIQRAPSLTLSQPSTGPYIPPPVSNPSAGINQLNQSFPLNGGLGNNPTNRDAYIRYNLNR